MSGRKPDGKESTQRKRSRSRSQRQHKKVAFAKRETLASNVRRECKVIEAGVSSSLGNHEAPLPAPFLLNEDGLRHLTSCYGLGVSILQAMGWKAGSGIGRRSEGWLEPVSVKALGGPALHRGRKDRRCVGVEPPRRFIDSDVESGASQRDAQTIRSGSSRSSSRASGRRKRRKRRRKRRRSSSSSSRSSSGSSSSEDSRKRRRKKLRRARMRAQQSPPKVNTKASSGAPGGAPTGTSTGAAGGVSAGTAGASAGAAGVPVPQAAVNEPPEIALAKKQVLAKLTTMKNIEPKEQRAKAFRELLRQWHPDKNPERIEMATAVFQFLQKGKSLLSLGAAAK